MLLLLPNKLNINKLFLFKQFTNLFRLYYLSFFLAIIPHIKPLTKDLSGTSKYKKIQLYNN